MTQVADFIARAAQECGFERERFVDSKIPQDFDKIVVILFLGDVRSLSVLSMLLFNSFRDVVLKDKYVIFCSFPGMGNLFPTADEYWSVSDSLAISSLMSHTLGFNNLDKKANSLEIQLRRRFYTVITSEDFTRYYDNGLTTSFFERFEKVRRFFPQISSWRNGDYSMALSQRGGMGIFVFPNMQGKCWYRNKEISIDLPKGFWIKLTERLLENKFIPVIYQNQISYDISPHFGERCFYCSDRNLSSVLCAMRSAGCVLDVFSGISRLAVISRCPFVVMDERQRYIKSKEFEINDLCIAKMYPYRYIFSFPTIIGGEDFNGIMEQIINVTKKFVPKLVNIDLPALTESYKEVSYDSVKQHKVKKLGIHFIKVKKLEIK